MRNVKVVCIFFNFFVYLQTQAEQTLRKETDDNTQTNELSPAAAYDR